jgi:prephenate dehydratase
VDFEGNRADKRVQKALKQIEGLTTQLKVLGSYPSRTQRHRSVPRPARRN